MNARGKGRVSSAPSALCYSVAMRYFGIQMRLNGCQPRTLATLQELQESNYRRLLRLAPDLELIRGTVVSRVAGALDMYLVVEERCRYTTTLMLTYRFEAEEGTISEPNVRVRVYHDARMADAISHSRRHPPHHAPCRRRQHPTELERKWELNRFLQKWLGYGQHQGHLFLRYGEDFAAPAARSAVSEVD